MTMIRLLLVVALAAPRLLSAQGSLPVKAGDRVRILYSFPEARDRYVVGRLMDSDFVLLHLREQQVVQPLLWNRVRSVQVSVKPRSPHAETTGAVIGGLAGAFLFKLWADQRYGNDEWNGAGAATVGVPAGAVAGFLLGWLVGAEQWQTIAKRSSPVQSRQSAMERNGLWDR